MDYYVAPTPAGLGNGSEGNPAEFSVSTLNNTKLGNTGPTHIRVHFAPGDYTVDQTLWITEGNAPASRTVELIGEQVAGGPRPRLILGAHPTTPANPNWADGTAHHWLIRTAVSPNNGYQHYLNRMVVTNLVLDGNFDGQGAFTGPAKVGGYKSFALDLNAKTGCITNVLVKQFGSVGEIPGSYFNVAGTETFPVRVQTFNDTKTGYSGPPNGLYPWLIENLEVTEFRSLHGGYATLIMPLVRSVCTNPLNNCVENDPTDPAAQCSFCKFGEHQLVSGVLGTRLR